MVAEKKALQAANAEMATAFEDYKKGAQAEIAKVRETAAGEVAGLATRHAEDMALTSQGVTDALGRDTVRRAWDAAPKDSRGKSPAEWWQKQVEAHKAHAASPDDPKIQAPEVPIALKGYLPTVEAPTKAQQGRGTQGAGRSVDAGTARASVQPTLDKVLNEATDLESLFKGLGAASRGAA